MSGTIIKKALSLSYSFPKSKGEIEALRRISKESRADSGDAEAPDWEVYTSALNICTEFGEQLLTGIRALDSFNNRAIDMHEEYMPALPPLSPVTNTFFASWLALDAPINDEFLTLGLIFSRYIREKQTLLYATSAMDALNGSYASFYQVAGGDLRRTVLWDIPNRRELTAQVAMVDYTRAIYAPSIGDVWYTRLIPPLVDTGNPWIVFGIPYVFRTTKRKDWEDFFRRRNAAGKGRPDSLAGYLKRGDSFGYWLEFVFQAYAGHTREVIFVEGLPDIRDSRPHGCVDGGRLA